MFVPIDIAGTTGAMDLVIDVALCGEAIGHWLCIPDPPIRVINIHKFDFTALPLLDTKRRDASQLSLLLLSHSALRWLA